MGSRTISNIRSGDWITLRRLRGYPAILLFVYALAIGATFATSDGSLDASGRPLGTDFANVWSAGRLVLQGSPEAAYDPARHHAEQQRIFDDPDVPFYGWHYPPIFLALAGALAHLPYLPALVLWQAVTGALYLWTVHRIAPQRIAWLLAAAFPAVFANLTHGHNGFLTAALLGGGLAALRTRPVLAGVLFGLLAYKPQFGLLLPFALAAGGRWRAFVAAAVTVALLIGGTVAWFGAEIWSAFFDSLDFTTTVVLEAGGTSWFKQQSAFAVVRRLGGSVDVAYAVQIALAVACLATVYRLWRSPAGFALKAAGLVVGTLLATPYLFDYDLLALAPAIAFLGVNGLKTGFADYEKSALAFVWIVPFFTRPLGEIAPVSPGLAAMLLLMGVLLARAARDARALAAGERVAAEV